MPDNMHTYLNPLKAFVAKEKPKTVLEIGFGFEGYSAHVFLDAGCNLISVDKKDWQGNAAKIDSPKFRFIEGDSKEVLPTLSLEFDLVYVDGDHAYEGAYTDIYNSRPLVKPGGVLLIDDYGVTRSVIDMVDYVPIEGDYGVKQAADELMGDWERLPDTFANGGVAYRRPHAS